MASQEDKERRRRRIKLRKGEQYEKATRTKQSDGFQWQEREFRHSKESQSWSNGPRYEEETSESYD